ncbi:BA75_01137T0 [Komagataella pastoris]|uniref:BA75_01137T0 n=1 Tax=Komagataella pastoris TaxID=4922 RepID=A0A1B2J9X6_PICPA|nr:BA75_01137T0 [Komagataella pastoris]
MTERFSLDVPVTNLDGHLEEDDVISDPIITNLQDYQRPSFMSSIWSKLFNKSSDDEFFLEDIELEGGDLGVSSSFSFSRDKRVKMKRSQIALLVGFVGVVALLGGWLVRGVLNSDLDKIPDVNISVDQNKVSNKKLLLNNGTTPYNPTTIVISLDGFHPHYISPDLTPFMHDLLSKGYGAPYMVPSFPSSTFPNHWTMITGLFPSEHGIVGNTFFDPDSNTQFVNTNPKLSLDPEWWGGEPIWKTLDAQNITTSVHMWPGSEVPFKEGRPLQVDPYNGFESLDSKKSTILNWLDNDISERPELILSYVPMIDSLGHKYGTHGEKLTEGLKSVDSFLDSVYQGITERNLTDIANLIVVSDHGMAPTSNERLIYLDDIVDMDSIDHIDGWPLFGIRPKIPVDIFLEELEVNWENHSLKEHFNVYLKENLPEEWHFGTITNQYSGRIAPIWVVPKVGWSITTHYDMEYKMEFDYKPKGVHGYNNTEVLMRAIFLGVGPYFTKTLQSDLKVNPFPNTELYNIICNTFDVTPAPNNGSLDVISHKNLLPIEWHDSLNYPGIQIDDEPFMVINSSYDQIWRVSYPENPKFDMTETRTQTTTTATSSSSSNPSSSASTGNKIGEFIIDVVDDIEEAIEDAIEDASDLVEEVSEDISEAIGNWKKQ